MRNACPGARTPDQLSLGAITTSCKILLSMGSSWEARRGSNITPRLHLSSSALSGAVRRTAAPISGLISEIRRRRRRHVSVDARTKAIEPSDGVMQTGVEVRVSRDKGGRLCERGRFGQGGTTV